MFPPRELNRLPHYAEVAESYELGGAISKLTRSQDVFYNSGLWQSVGLDSQRPSSSYWGRRRLVIRNRLISLLHRRLPRQVASDAPSKPRPAEISSSFIESEFKICALLTTGAGVMGK
jgi:hypothetical protein